VRPLGAVIHEPASNARFWTAIAALTLSLLFAAGSARAAPAGRVIAWGCGTGGDLGQCRVPGDLAAVTTISAGYAHGLALERDGTVAAWGCDPRRDFGQCRVPGDLTGVAAIAAGGSRSLALKSDGTVVTWGCNGDPQCNAPSGLGGVRAIAAGLTHSLALRGDGTVVAWGCSTDYGQCNVPNGLSGVTAISAGTSHSLALKSDGTVVAWGCGGGADHGQCSVPNGLSGVTAISAGFEHSLALKGDGTVVAWGCGDDYGQCSVPVGLSGVTAISAGEFHNLALKADGTAVAWGCAYGSGTGACSVPTGLSRVRAIAAGSFHSLALVELNDQTIAFGPVRGRSYGEPDFTVSAAASSGLPVSFGASGDCTVRGSTVHLAGVGSCTLTASQPGDASYNPAPDVAQTFSIAPGCKVPNVVGLRLVAARRAIARRHCGTGKVRHVFGRRKKGTVISQSRRPGRILSARSKIDLVVSRGRRR
jgi:Regulator of chromosome condensation (RCC1) repeat/PASTA domain